ncbi:unnamed protein product [Strongylus vulgaris]|uniref:VWFA domain-containing protein n=1 Tax=Strongylus vulgaris TaxID=40348 RepID=A0A3P7ISG6_STRVU|nr:unnamed protein product [Strongylus vulgaris]
MEVIADVATVFDPTTIKQGEGHHSRVGIVTYGEKAEARYQLNAFNSADDFVHKIWEIETAKDNSSDLRDALMVAEKVLRDGRPKGGHYEDARQLAEQIKIGGTDIIVIGFDQYGKPNALEQIRKEIQRDIGH